MSINLSQENVVKDWRSNPSSIKKYNFVYSFLPHPERKKRAGLLSLKALFLYAVFFVFVALSVKVIPQYAPGILGYASDIYVDELLKYTNSRRAEAGLSPLTLDPALSLAASEKAKDMFKNNYWAHVSPDGTQPWDFIISAGYDYSYAGENLAKNFTASRQVVDAWYDSPSHKENLLGPNYEHVGFAVVNGILDGYETTLVVQTFGKPRTPTYLSSAAPEALPESPVEVPAETVTSELGISLPSEAEDAAFVGSANQAAAPRDPFIDVVGTTRFLGFAFISFVSLLLMIDIWYSRKRNIRKVAGHALAHLLFLVFVFGVLWLALSPGSIL